MKETVYYYNEKLNAIVSREQLKEWLDEGDIARYWHVPVIPKFPLDEDPFLLTQEPKVYMYKLNEIPLHDDWRTIVKSDLNLEVNEYAHFLELMHLSNTVETTLELKLINNIKQLEDYRYKGIKFD